VRAAAVALAAVALCGCGAATSASRPSGHATLWVTRDRGAHVLLVRRVAAGQTAMAALAHAAHVETRYGGRYVQAIDGLAGSLTHQRDWFYFVNGYESDLAATEYTLHDGDVEWWDYRNWSHAAHVPVVAGAFPEPFLHGFGGRRRSAVVVATDARSGKALAREVHGRLVRRDAVPHGANVLVLAHAAPVRLEARLRDGAGGPGAPVELRFSGDWHDLVAGRYRYRYSVP
jgi:hypothetical protein